MKAVFLYVRCCESELSFATKSEKSMNRMLNQVIRHYAKNRYFDGAAIHHVHSWKKLRKQEQIDLRP